VSTKKTKTIVSVLPKPKRRARSRKQQRVIWLAQEIFAGMTIHNTHVGASVHRNTSSEVAARAAHALVSAKVFWAMVEKEEVRR
jgi:hypothetical protein